MAPEDTTGRIELHRTAGDILEVQLCGHFTLERKAASEKITSNDAAKTVSHIRFVDAGIEIWDSSLLTFLMKIRGFCEQHSIEMDLSGLPEGVQRLIDLAIAVPDRSGDSPPVKQDPFVTRLGLKTLEAWHGFLAFLRFLGEATVALVHFVTRRARYRSSDLWLYVQECGPQALGIVTLISVLVGAILAFVGAIQLKMFGAEIYVANLVGLGMVIEMGSLMTGIILAGRTGAAFAAQLGTMQVNEEIDALVTMGISPMEYLVLPRMVALALMTPLLVIYADVLGILGGSVVGIFALDIPATLFFKQTFSMLTLWHCAQGMIKGTTFGVVVALAGCLRGMQCGRSASAVGDATTSAVVTSIVAIVLTDAMWTFIFMVGGG
jgi:phospholipid/cholesterol/gamma-HCH transport system permease protein